MRVRTNVRLKYEHVPVLFVVCVCLWVHACTCLCACVCFTVIWFERLRIITMWLLCKLIQYHSLGSYSVQTKHTPCVVDLAVDPWCVVAGVVVFVVVLVVAVVDVVVVLVVVVGPSDRKSIWKPLYVLVPSVVNSRYATLPVVVNVGFGFEAAQQNSPSVDALSLYPMYKNLNWLRVCLKAQCV